MDSDRNLLPWQLLLEDSEGLVIKDSELSRILSASGFSLLGVGEWIFSSSELQPSAGNNCTLSSCLWKDAENELGL